MGKAAVLVAFALKGCIAPSRKACAPAGAILNAKPATARAAVKTETRKGVLIVISCPDSRRAQGTRLHASIRQQSRANGRKDGGLSLGGRRRHFPTRGFARGAGLRFA
jgi:hypothetical protein